MKNLSIFLFLLISIILVSCGSKSDSMAYEGGYSDDMAKTVAYNLSEEEVIPITREESESTETIKIVDRKIIREGDISFETDSLGKTANHIHKTVKELKGYISKDNVNDYGYRTEQIINIRIPAENFDKLLAQISKAAKKIDSKNISARDVTEEYIDVESRVKTKKDLETRYTEILQKAHSVSEILQIERELGVIRSEIESAEGRLRYLKNNVSFSTLEITFYTSKNQEFGFGSKLANALEGGWDGLLWFFIGLIYIWPFILIITFGIWLLVRLIKRRSKRKALK